ncbi:UDP-2-acetamido-2,6-dideoxy-beta-L-arabino-hexopyranos-4-ulose 3-epimerase and UDP-2-acetamido-2,6-dideoxy-beta-L-lyxo-hexopyranos-4-ulose 4-(Re)-reductase, putative [Geotalea daltonii FRC-32]|uniref:dTDP-4-dehydrorhamnose reductase n=1 Tax=Geotalea daltonii (strain DSM 22248 / JCM 15807 / FRC-32) TaxID=316067 RepID=B9M8Z3_GEODF|nr:SDR family oxidoreductase [Geotalea daltonii]ACM20489.1 UDP-2-acetamido-2,6-dideoxy-beta-L-arabino-hexopyranos-4-ulose 3-epimerase and UDP-2-acetamido-2,6-dideoxy-beta-L-lyxo-hexopyranos-4-ulose 4-(Re)-reductase, putative [Geotalea daltonii FRC-32]
MRILILGGDGMLGHQLLKHLQPRHEVKVTLRQDLGTYSSLGMFTSENAYDGVDVRSLERLVEVLSDFRPEAIINAVGIVKQRPDAKESIPSLEINALLPHRLAVLCKGIGARLIHLSTDCVFSGKKGSYLESDLSDAEDLYGKTKFLGEVHDTNCLTLRTSIIGHELSRHKSLLDWFLAQTGAVKGFTNAIYTGFTTIEMSRIIEKMLLDFPNASGVYQVSSEPINKYELLLLFREKLGHNIELIADSTFCCDRSLDSARFRREFNYTPPSWPAMIEGLNR